MTLLPAIPNDRTVARRQMGLSILLVLGMGVAMLAVNLLVYRYDRVLLPRRLAEWQRKNGFFRDSRFYPNPEQRLIYNVLPSVDYSRGGVYFVGASQMQSAMILETLPADEQKLIHDYGLVAMTNTRRFQFVRYLVENQGLLAAGGEKTLVVLDLYFGSTAHRQPLTANDLDYSYLWVESFTAFGMYSDDPRHGIEPVPMSDLGRQFRLMKIRDHAFSVWILKNLERENLDYLRLPEPRRPEMYRSFWTEFMGTDWKAGMDVELAEFDHLIDYLQSRHVRLQAVYLPLGSWFDDFAPSVRYREKVLALMSSKGVPVVDLNHKLTDDYFIDSAHFNFNGAEQLHPILMNVVRRHLRETGALK